MNRIRVLLADDHLVVRAGIRALFDGSDLDVIGEAADGDSALQLALHLEPDVAVIDFCMPGRSGAEVAARLRTDAPTVRVLILSAHEERAYLRQAFEAGANGYVLKSATAEGLIQAIQTVAAGGTYLDPALAAHVVAGLVGFEPAANETVQPLSDREAEVLRLVATGYVNKEVAARLGLSVKTVETYKLRAMEKLHFRSRVDIVRHAYRAGWLDENTNQHRPPETIRVRTAGEHR